MTAMSTRYEVRVQLIRQMVEDGRNTSMVFDSKIVAKMQTQEEAQAMLKEIARLVEPHAPAVA